MDAYEDTYRIYAPVSGLTYVQFSWPRRVKRYQLTKVAARTQPPLARPWKVSR